MDNSTRKPSITFRISNNLKRELDEEMEKYPKWENLSEFLNDAVKFYLKDLANERHKKLEYESGQLIDKSDEVGEKQTS